MYETIFLPRKINKGKELFFCNEKSKKSNFERDLNNLLLIFFLFLFGGGAK